jgi:DNA polymerase-1
MPKRAIAYDTETSGLQYFGDWHDMFSFGTCDWDGKCKVFRLDGSEVRKVQSTQVLKRLWGDKNKNLPKAMHNAKFDIAFTERYLGRKLDGHAVHDTLVMSKLLRSNHYSHRLNDLAWELAGVPTDDEDALRPWKNEYQHAPESLMDRYQRRDGERGMLRYRVFKPKIDAAPKLRELYDTEMRLIWVTLRMEGRGLMVNRPRCQKIIKRLHKQAEAVKQEFGDAVEEITGNRFYPNQTGRVAELLFDHLDMPVLKKTAKGDPSTDKDAVILPLRESHPHPILELILKYRSWSHGASILASYMKHADHNGIIHPVINTTGAHTGRESCSNPNLQNVSKEGVLKNPYPIPARKAFCPRPGFVNFHIDYSGIELRLLVHYSGDQILVEEVSRPGGDPHAMAARIFYPPFTKAERAEFHMVEALVQMGFEAQEKDSDDWSTLRGAAKNCNFGVPYGGGAKKAAQILNLPLELGKRRFARYVSSFPKLLGLNSKVGAQAKADGFIDNAFGRRVRVDRRKSYTATNYLIQSTAADVLKVAQVRVAPFLQKATGGEMQILLPIHDELIIECPRKRLKDAPEILRSVRELMIDFPMFNVPLEVDVKLATYDWANKSKYPL